MSQKLQDRTGKRKYMSRTERNRFLEAAGSADRMTHTLCLCLAYSGCRISEVLKLTAARVDLAEMTLSFRVHRSVPVPERVIETLDLVHGIREKQKSGQAVVRLWPWGRSTASRKVYEVIRNAGIAGTGLSGGQIAIGRG